MKLILHSCILFAVALLVIPAYGQHMNEQDSPCADVVVTSELTKCLSDAKDRADAKLNSAYKEIQGRLQGADAGNLIRAQRFWIQYRDANCAAERDLYEGGTAKDPVYFACLDSMIRSRMRELQVTYAARSK
jgi:uncharacterized protein YecT (DUF1311 family)